MQDLYGTAESRPRSRWAPANSTHSPITDREREIVTLVGHGLSNDQIAEQLVISPLTVKTHVNRAMLKLGARDRAQVVVTAYQTGLAHPGSAETQQAGPLVEDIDPVGPHAKSD